MSKYTLENIPTPALVIDEAKAKANIKKLADYAADNNIGVRPHTKTHKSLLMGKHQTAGGATGLTVAKVGELEIMKDAHDDLLLAYPALDPARTGRVAAVAKEKTVRVALDSQFAADQLAEAARAAGATIGILVDFDIGMRRTGLQTAEQTLELAKHVDSTDGLRLDGLFVYPGHISGSTENITTRLTAANEQTLQVLDLWKENGLEAGIVSGGSTPTAYYSHLFTAYTEIRPGTYIYNDRDVSGGGWCSVDECAAVILATVVSNAVPGKLVLDAGGKTLTYDRYIFDPADKRTFGTLMDYENADLVGASEEHGMVDISNCDNPPKLGDRVRVLMNHVCPCVNLQDSGYLIREDGSLEPLPIDARGKLS